jgi:uncharacterized phage protein gp47/JayE
MPTYGSTPEGFLRKPVRQILADIEARQRATISPSLNLATDQPWGQNNGIFANELGIAWEILEVCYNAFDPDQTVDFLLTSLAKLTGTERRGASYSRVTATCTLAEGTTLESGVHFAALDDDPASLWTPEANFTAPSTGDHEIVFRATVTGPVVAQAGTLVISTSVFGWSAITNALAADPGRNVDTDDELRQRREEQLAATGSSTVDGIRADVLKVEGIETCKVFENPTDSTVDGMPPHSIEVLIYDGVIPSVDNDVIAQAIWDTKTGGAATIGSESGTALDADGVERIVNFSRPELVEIYVDIAVQLGKSAEYLTAGGDESFAEFLAAQYTAMHPIGEDVRWRRVDSVAFQYSTPNTTIRDVTTFKLGTTASPTGTDNIVIGSRQLAVFDAARITVTTA